MLFKGGAERRKIRKLRNSLGKQHRSVDRLRKNLRRCKYDNEDEVSWYINFFYDSVGKKSKNCLIGILKEIFNYLYFQVFSFDSSYNDVVFI